MIIIIGAILFFFIPDDIIHSEKRALNKVRKAIKNAKTDDLKLLNYLLEDEINKREKNEN